MPAVVDQSECPNTCSRFAKNAPAVLGALVGLLLILPETGLLHAQIVPGSSRSVSR